LSSKISEELGGISGIANTIRSVSRRPRINKPNKRYEKRPA
jgi:hypothetical protein